MEDINMQWSRYSEALFDAFSNTDDNIIVQACPGAGKTTNIKHLWTLDDKPTVYLVFNKHNQLEVQGKMGDKAESDVLTLNGLGHRILMDNYGRRLKLDNRKVYTIIKDIEVFTHWDKRKFEKTGDLAKAVTMAKQYFLKDDIGEDAFNEMCSVYDLEQYDDMYSDAINVLQESDDRKLLIDFADQIRFPALFDLHMPQYDNVLGDEWQDASPIQLKMVRKLDARRYVFVGDTHQSIYGFRGAMDNSMEITADMFSCVTLPLSITYRCAKNIVKEAYRIFPDIEEWDESGEGLVRYSDIENERYEKSDIVLCRFNAPLVELAYTLLRQGIACHVRGSDIAQGLVRLIDKQKAVSVADLIDKLSQWHETEVYKARRKEDEGKEKSVDDKYNSLMLFTEKCNLNEDVSCVKTQIELLFAEGRGVCLSTIHKAKGLEAERAMVLGSKSLPIVTKRQQPWQAKQERNCQYVAVTRAKSELIYM